MESQFGLINVWTQGDLVTKGVFLLLLGMSLASWIVILIKALDLRKFSSQARTTESFWHAADFADGVSKLGSDPANPFRQLALEGLAHPLQAQRRKADRFRLGGGKGGRCLCSAWRGVDVHVASGFFLFRVAAGHG